MQVIVDSRCGLNRWFLAVPKSQEVQQNLQVFVFENCRKANSSMPNNLVAFILITYFHNFHLKMDMSGVSIFFYHSGIQNGKVVVACEWPAQTETDRKNFDTDAASWPAQVACRLNSLHNQRIFSFLSCVHAYAGTIALKIKVSREIFVSFLWF